MRFVRLLPERWQKLLREMLKFGSVGVINGVINYAVFNALALTVFADGELKANVVATLVATTSSYLLNRHWTYRDRPKSAVQRETLLFFLFNAAGLVIELGVLTLAKYGFGISDLLALNVAKTVGVGLATIFRFWSYRTFVFRKEPPAPVSAKRTPTPFVPTPSDAVLKTSGPAPLPPRRDGETLAELDPVAELAEKVTERTESDRHHDHRDHRARSVPDGQDAPAIGVPPAAAAAGGAEAGNGTGTDGTARTGSDQPLEVQFAETIDAALETELAAELNAASRRSSTR